MHRLLWSHRHISLPIEKKVVVMKMYMRFTSIEEKIRKLTWDEFFVNSHNNRDVRTPHGGLNKYH